MSKILFVTALVATLGALTYGFEWNFVECGKYPQDAPGVSGDGKCAGEITSFVTKDLYASGKNKDNKHLTHHRPHEDAIDLKGWEDIKSCKAKDEVRNDVDIFGNNIHTSLASPTSRKCAANYGGSTVGEKTPTTGYGINQNCYAAHKALQCTSGKSSYEVCGVDAEMTYRDASGNIKTKLDGEEIPKIVKFKTVACQSMCRRYSKTCCDAGFVGRSKVLASALGYTCNTTTPMFYYDSSWMEEHMHCDAFPISTHEVTFSHNGGNVHLKTKCYDPICDSADSADSFCSPQQYNAKTTKSTNDKGAAHSLIPSFGVFLSIFAVFLGNAQ